VPPTLSIGAFVLGGVLLLLSVVRGGFKIFGAEVKETAGGIARVVAFLAGVILIVTGFLHDGKDQPDKTADRGGAPVSAQTALVPPSSTGQALPQGEASSAPHEANRPPRQSNPDPVMRVEWRRAETQELMDLIAKLTDAERSMLSMNVMATGNDVYAIHVRVTNVGAVPVEVSPERFQLSFAGQPIPLNRTDDRRFFRAIRLEPNRFVEGILTFNANITVGTAIATGGRLVYQDAGIQVQYAR
jgi:hypothetical protein